jgi:hypothetical protein
MFFDEVGLAGIPPDTTGTQSGLNRLSSERDQ